MEFAVLGLLYLSPMTIYDLNLNFKKSLSLIYSASYGSLQTAIKKLLQKGYITMTSTVENGRQKNIYQMTTEGSTAFFHWMHDEIPESKLEVTALSKLHFLGLLPHIEERIVVLKRIIEQIKQVTSELESYQAELSNLPRTDPVLHYQLSSLDYGVMAHKSALQFFENLYNELLKQQKA